MGNCVGDVKNCFRLESSSQSNIRTIIGSVHSRLSLKQEKAPLIKLYKVEYDEELLRKGFTQPLPRVEASPNLKIEIVEDAIDSRRYTVVSRTEPFNSDKSSMNSKNSQAEDGPNDLKVVHEFNEAMESSPMVRKENDGAGEIIPGSEKRQELEPSGITVGDSTAEFKM